MLGNLAEQKGICGSGRAGCVGGYTQPRVCPSRRPAKDSLPSQALAECIGGRGRTHCGQRPGRARRARREVPEGPAFRLLKRSEASDTAVRRSAWAQQRRHTHFIRATHANNSIDNQSLIKHTQTRAHSNHACDLLSRFLRRRWVEDGQAKGLKQKIRCCF